MTIAMEVLGNAPHHMSLMRTVQQRKATRGRARGPLPTIVETEHDVLVTDKVSLPVVFSKASVPMADTCTGGLILAAPASHVLFDSLALESDCRRQPCAARLVKSTGTDEAETHTLRGHSTPHIQGMVNVDRKAKHRYTPAASDDEKLANQVDSKHKRRNLYEGLLEERPSSQVLVDALGLDAGCSTLRRASRSARAKAATKAAELKTLKSAQITKLTWQCGTNVKHSHEEAEVCSTASTSCESLSDE